MTKTRAVSVFVKDGTGTLETDNVAGEEKQETSKYISRVLRIVKAREATLRVVEGIRFVQA